VAYFLVEIHFKGDTSSNESVSHFRPSFASVFRPINAAEFSEQDNTTIILAASSTPVNILKRRIQARRVICHTIHILIIIHTDSLMDHQRKDEATDISTVHHILYLLLLIERYFTGNFFVFCQEIKNIHALSLNSLQLQKYFDETSR